MRQLSRIAQAERRNRRNHAGVVDQGGACKPVAWLTLQPGQQALTHCLGLRQFLSPLHQLRAQGWRAFCELRVGLPRNAQERVAWR